MKTFLGWVLLTYVVLLNQSLIVSSRWLSQRLWARLVLTVLTPVLVGFCLANFGVRLLGGAS